MPKDRPNILIITTDQHRADCYSFARADIRTPHLESLARRGTRFDRCYCPGPLCQPARASILTGLLPHTHGVRDNGIDLPEAAAAQGFAARATALGYRSAFLGKAHFSTPHSFAPTGRPECRFSMADYGESWFGPYMGFEHVELFVDGPVKWPDWVPPQGQHFTRWFFADGHGTEKDALYRSGRKPASGAQQVHVPDLPLPWHSSSWLGDRATRLIEDHDPGEPLLLWVSFPDPHHPFDAPEPYDRMYAPGSLDLPPERTLDLARRPWWHEASLSGTPETTEEFRKVREEMSRQREVTDEQLRDITASYFGMISLVDHTVGRVLASLTACGLQDDTVVIVTSDHGEFLGDHGLLFKGPMLYDSLIRVALVVAGPGVAAGRVVPDVVSTMDLAPTIVELCGGQAEGFHGVSLRDTWGPNPPAASNRHAHIEWDLSPARCGVALDLHSVVTPQYRYTIERGSGAGELYDLEADPREMVNLFDEAAGSEARRRMEGLLSSRPDDRRPEPLPFVGMC